MDDTRLFELEEAAAEVVRTAHAAGEIDAETFTLGIARKRVAAQMGLGEEGLDGKKWKKLVKEVLTNALDALPSSQVDPSPSAPRPNKLSKAGKKAGKEEATSPLPKERVKKGKAKQRVVDPDEDREDGENEGVELSKDGAEVEQDEKSDSEMSVLIDEPPKKKRRAKGGDGKDAPAKKKRKSDSGRRDGSEDDTPSSKKQKQAKGKADDTGVEDPKVKELKAIIGACGVRKVWKKELQDKDTVKAQISHLQGILSGLGMKGQPTKAKAAAIKKQRELAAELGDIMEFEKTRGLGTASKEAAAELARPRRAAAPKKLQETHDDSDSEDETGDDDDAEDAAEESESEVEYASDASEEPEEPKEKRQRKRAASSPEVSSEEE